MKLYRCLVWGWRNKSSQVQSERKEWIDLSHTLFSYSRTGGFDDLQSLKAILLLQTGTLNWIKFILAIWVTARLSVMLCFHFLLLSPYRFFQANLHLIVLQYVKKVHCCFLIHMSPHLFALKSMFLSTCIHLSLASVPWRPQGEFGVLPHAQNPPSLLLPSVTLPACPFISNK